MEFYPNACMVCHSGNVKRCSRCQMISYCGPDHQKQHWQKHKDICKVISNLIKASNVSHIYEDLRNADFRAWNWGRLRKSAYVSSKLGRPLDHVEEQMLQLPRICFVCHDARQDLLKNCPGCPVAAFCKNHPTSSLHKMDCAEMKYIQELNDRMPIRKLSTGLAIMTIGPKIIQGTPYADKTMKKIPASMIEFLYEYAKPKEDLREELMLTSSGYLSVPLSLFSAMKKLKYKSRSKIVVHLATCGRNDACFEVLFHLIPNLTRITVVFLMLREDKKKIPVVLCSECLKRRKTFMIESTSLSCKDYMTQKNYRKPDFVMYLNLQPPAIPESDPMWQGVLNDWRRFSCPLVITGNREKIAKRLSENVRSVFPESRICYDGLNEFLCLPPEIDTLDCSVSKINQFMIVVRGSQSRTE